MSHPSSYDENAIRGQVVEVLEDMTRDWDRQYSEAICGQTRLVADLGCESIDFVMLIVSIEGVFQQKNLPFEALLTKNGRFVGDVTVDQITQMLVNALQAKVT